MHGVPWRGSTLPRLVISGDRNDAKKAPTVMVLAALKSRMNLISNREHYKAECVCATALEFLPQQDHMRSPMILLLP